ncbi:MAK10-like protein [Tanacetum coccineum]
MASQDARLSKFEADFKQQQSKMTNKIDTVLKAINDRITGALPSDTFKARQKRICIHPRRNAYENGRPRTISLYLFKKLKIKQLEEANHVFGLADGTKSYPVGIVRDVEVHIGKLKLLNDFYVIDMKKDLETPLLVGRGFLATTNAVIDCRKAKIKEFMNYYFPGEWEIARDAEINPFKDVLVFRRMIEFLGALPINLKGNMWESEDLIENPINWDKPPKKGDGAWHAKIRIIDPDGEEFGKTFQSIPTSKILS